MAGSVLLEGDGSFQATCQELGTIIRLRSANDDLHHEQPRLYLRTAYPWDG